jgi:hypothetical protein
LDRPKWNKPLVESVILVFYIILSSFLVSGTYGILDNESGQSYSTASASNPIAQVTLSGIKNHVTASSGYIIELFRYPIGGGEPTLVSEMDSAHVTSSTVSLYDLSTSTSNYAASTPIHYAILVIGHNSTFNFVYSYDWSLQSTANGQKTKLFAIDAPQIQNPLDGGYYEWLPVKNWTGVYTIVGEVHSDSHVNDYFTYGVGAGTNLNVMLNMGAGWYVSGSVAMYSSITQKWPAFNLTGGYNAKSQFNYEEDELYHCNQIDICQPLGEYKIYVVAYDGGWEHFSQAGLSPNQHDLACPSQVKAGKWGAWDTQYPGGQVTFTNMMSEYYSAAVVLANPIGGGPSVTIGSTTNYSSFAQHYFTFSNYYSFYLLYSNDFYGWPVIYVTDSGVNC